VEVWLLYPIFKNFEVVVVNMDYRLALKHTYPMYVEDCWDALRWTMEQIEELGGDPKRVIHAGSKVGGCLPTVLAQKARETHMQVHGVLLNVTVTRRPRFFSEKEYKYTSYVLSEAPNNAPT
jgi:acetyl esterase/lipase